MADVLLNKVINEEINIDLFVNWLLKAGPENVEDTKKIVAYNVAQVDFITYFLNFIHEEVPCNGNIGDIPQKVNTPKRIDKVQIKTARDENYSVRSNLFPSQTNIPSQNDAPNSTADVSIGRYSTPKDTKTPVNKNTSYFSPVSPLYQNHHGFNSKDSKNDSATQRSADKHSLCLGDFIVLNSKSSSKKKKGNTEAYNHKKEASRRIKPTSIFQKQINSDFQRTQNSFNFQENTEEVPVKTITEQRNVLVEERMKILSRKDSLEKNSHVLFKRHNSLSKSDITPTLNEITFKNHIEYVVTIYTIILKNKLVLNITSEIYFLISLLLSKQPNQDPKIFVQGNTSEDPNLGVEYLDQFKRTDCTKDQQLSDNSIVYNSEIFETIHNVVYFAVKCLEAQIDIIKLYDKTTIRFLADNDRLQNYSRAFSKRLSTYGEKKVERPYIEIATPRSQSNVCFNIDTDNKEYFPDQSCFHAFRKQRDLFYEILRIWETYHLTSDWTFSFKLGGKIKTLFSLNPEPTNFIHLARLFKNQLVSSCAKGPKEKGLSENNLSFLPSLAIDTDKLNRLTSRLVTKQSSNGINSLPVFSGYQEFYRDFIVVASNNVFNKHLEDILICEIIELNDTKFSGIDIEEEESEIDPNTRKSYINCIKNLRILAKFLGFIETLPYKSEFPNISKNILESQIKIREQITPALNIKLLLNRSIEKHTVVLLIPWLTKYLAMLDFVTIRLPYYKSINNILFKMYKNCDNSGKNSYNNAVVKFCLGWLFELPHFPDSEYFNFCSQARDTSNVLIQENVRKNICNGINGTRIKTKSKGLDQLGIVDQSVLYLCCPYLEEIKKLLSTNASSSNVAVKYITPVTAVESNSEMARKKLEQQLEDAFFSGQPASLRKTIEFISERIASTAVKYICHDLVPKAKELAVLDLKENLLKNDSADKYSDDTQRKILLKKKATVLAQDHLSTFLQTCDYESQKIANQKIPASLDNLLSIDTLEGTKNVCVGIATKMYTERIKQWVKSHVNLTVFSKDFDSEIQKVVSGRRGEKDKAPFILPPSGRDSNHNEVSLSGFHLLNHIREACCDIIEKRDLSEEFVLNLLQETNKSLTERNDINDMITVIICNTLFDLCLLLVSNSPFVFSAKNNLIDHFAKIWILHPRMSTAFKGLFCQRNIKILQISRNSPEAWDTFAQVVAYLVDEKLIEQDDLESQCTGFYNRDWDQETLENFSNFLKKFISYSKCDTADSGFGYLLDFLSDFCSDL